MKRRYSQSIACKYRTVRSAGCAAAHSRSARRGGGCCWRQWRRQDDVAARHLQHAPMDRGNTPRWRVHRRTPHAQTRAPRRYSFTGKSRRPRDPIGPRKSAACVRIHSRRDRSFVVLIEEAFYHFPRLKERQKQPAGNLSGGETTNVGLGPRHRQHTQDFTGG